MYNIIVKSINPSQQAPPIGWVTRVGRLVHNPSASLDLNYIIYLWKIYTNFFTDFGCYV